MTSQSLNTLQSVALRGAFDPITLGLYVPSNIYQPPDYRDEITLIEHATFMHELTHYYQFYGTVFGYTHLAIVWGVTISIAERLQYLSQRGGFSCPAVANPFDWNTYCLNDENKYFQMNALTMYCYGQEEFYGWTFPQFITEPILDNQAPVISSSLFLRQASGYVLPVTGEVILENQASHNEIGFITTHSSKDATLRTLDNLYLSLPDKLASKYLGYSSWLGSVSLTHLEDIIYFILLNQPLRNVIPRLGDYTIAHNAKLILIYAHEFKTIPKPITESDLIGTINLIIDKTGLADPFQSINDTRELIIKGLDPMQDKYAVDLVALEFFTWILNNKMSAVRWPMNPLSLLESVPILQTHFNNDTSNQFVDILNEANPSHSKFNPEILHKHHRYASMIHLVLGLYNQPKTRCPLFVKDKPSVCRSCNNCSGYIPDPNIQADCPVVQFIDELGFTIKG